MITIIKGDKDLCKKSDGLGGLIPYQNAYLYESEKIDVKNLKELSDILKELEARPRHAILRDEPLESGKGRRTKERYRSTPRPWLVLDYDSPAPKDCPDYVKEPEKALDWLVEHEWPWLKGVGLHWQLGNSAGVVPSAVKMSWHLWVWLDKPVLNASRWLESKGFDRSMTNPVQIHYTASPIGVVIPKRSGFRAGNVLSGVYENPPPTPAGIRFQSGYQCTERDVALLDMELESLNGDKGRHSAIRWWILRAVSVNYPNIHERAVEKLESFGRCGTAAHSEVSRLISWAETGLIDGSLEPDATLRPDLVFSVEAPEVVLKADEVEEQEKALGCSSLIKGLKVADDKFDWLKANASKVAQLDTIEMGKIRAAWGQGVRMFDAAVREAMGGGEDFDWGKIADNFLAERKTPLIFVDGEWFSWNGKCYEVVDEIWVKKEISDTINEPTTSKVSNAHQQLQFSALKKFEGEPEGTPFLNGRLVKGALVPHTPKNGGRYCLGFNYDPTAVCPIWEQSLKEWFNDSERPLILRQWLHYLITGRSEIQKIMLFVGIQRGGKGTIISVIQSLIGEDNYSTPSMGNFASDFGLQSSLGRRALFISDAHLPQRDRSTILDRLKGISGKDRIDVNRKNLPPIKGARLGQIIIACNQMEDIKDESNALIDRYSLIKFTNSFLGKEDTERGANIEKELSGIFNWAMNCPAFTRFHEDKKGADVKDEMSQSANPVRAWSKSCCIEDPFTDTKTDDLYKSFEVWCDDNSIKYVMPKNAFIRSVKNVFPDAEVKLVRDGKKSRYKMMSGVKIDLEGLPEDELEAF